MRMEIATTISCLTNSKVGTGKRFTALQWERSKQRETLCMFSLWKYTGAYTDIGFSNFKYLVE